MIEVIGVKIWVITNPAIRNIKDEVTWYWFLLFSSLIVTQGLKKNIIEEFQLGFVPWKNNFYEDLLTNV